MSESKIKNVACIFTLNATALDSRNNDLTLIKEAVEHENGEITRRIRLEENVQRSYYITKKSLQNHQDKKESVSLEEVDEYRCNQARLASDINAKLNYVGGERPILSRLSRSPYLYGSDIDVTTLLKNELDVTYESVYGSKFMPLAKRGMLDFESDVVYGHGRILMGTLCLDDHLYLAVTEDFAKGIDDYANLVVKFADMTIGELLKERNLQLRVKVVKDDLAVVKALFSVAHKEMLDFICIWNMSFDINLILACLQRHGVNPADIFCDPSIPAKYRRFKWTEANSKKEKADGKVMNIDFTDLWHKVQALASFQIVCAMALFRTIRSIEQMRNSYSLDSVLTDYTKVNKLKWDGAKHIPASSIEWHRYMQAPQDDNENRVAYGLYCIFDGANMTILDDTTKDISTALLMYIGISQISRIKSNPKRLNDAYAVYLLERGRVLCSTSDNMVHEFDSELLQRTNWIITLTNFNVIFHAEGILAEGYEAFEMYSKVFRFVYDVDITSSYPTNQVILNISRDTTLAEVLHIAGLCESEQRRIGLNLTAVNSNAYDIGVKALGLPTFDEWDEIFEQEYAA